MALGHCRHRIHSLGWSIVMFFLIYWACIDEPWVSLVTRVQSAIKKRSNLLKNVSFTQAGLHIWAATALLLSIMNTPPAWQTGQGDASLFSSPFLSGLVSDFSHALTQGAVKFQMAAFSSLGQGSDLLIWVGFFECEWERKAWWCLQ